MAAFAQGDRTTGHGSGGRWRRPWRQRGDRGRDPCGGPFAPREVDSAASALIAPSEIEHVFNELARAPNTGLVVLPGPLTLAHRKQIIALAVRTRLPAAYPYRYYATDGGLMSYGVDTADAYRRVATYVDRILKGENPADIPVQRATKFELVINQQTAKTLGIQVPPSLLEDADEVIE
jgi:putative ABC transport system substrate-binding protein